MTWTIPEWWPFMLLALAAWRTFRLIGEDTILNRPRLWLDQRLGDTFELFIRCPFCAGFWISVVWWLAWLAWPHWTLVVAAPFALSAVVGLITVNLDPD